MRQPPHVLVISWWFPPLTEGGVYRPLNFVRHLQRSGVRVTVLTGCPPSSARQDASLLERLPEGVQILRCPHWNPFDFYDAFKRRRAKHSMAAAGAVARVADEDTDTPAPMGLRDRLSEPFAVPDKWRSWVAPATWLASTRLLGDEPDLIFSTSPPHSVQLVGAELASRFRCPWVVDFRDPWVDNPFRGFRVPAMLKRDQAMEAEVVAQATQIVANTRALERRFRGRFEGLERVRTIPNGFAADTVLGEPLADPQPPYRLVHVGHIYGLRSGRYLLQALDRLRQQQPEVAAALRIELVGALENQEDYLRQVRELGLESQLTWHGTVSHAEALAKQRQAHGLLILGVESQEPEIQVPGKIYEYFAARRPVVSLSRSGGAILETLQDARFPHVQAEPDDVDGIARALQAFVEGQQTGALSEFGDACIETYRYDRLTAQLLDCFEDAWAC